MTEASAAGGGLPAAAGPRPPAGAVGAVGARAAPAAARGRVGPAAARPGPRRARCPGAAGPATARATRLDEGASQLLRRTLEALASAEPGSAGEAPVALGGDAVEALVAAVSEQLAADDPLWRLADLIGQLRATDPDDVE